MVNRSSRAGVLLLCCFLASLALAQGKQELEGFSDDGLDSDEFEAPYVAPPVRPRAASDIAPPLVEPRIRKQDSLDYWDEDEFEGLPVAEVEPTFNPQEPADFEESFVEKERVPTKKPIPYLEAAGVLFFLLYALVFWYGRKENERIALAWATEFAGTNSILDKNFSNLGFGDEPDAPR